MLQFTVHNAQFTIAVEILAEFLYYNEVLFLQHIYGIIFMQDGK